MRKTHILGLDLSTTQVGYAITDLEGNLEIIGFDNPYPGGRVAQKLRDIEQLLGWLLNSNDDFYVSIEYPRGYDMSVMFKLGQINGATHMVLSRYTQIMNYAEYDPSKGKMALHGKGNADKQMQMDAFRILYPDWEKYRHLMRPKDFKPLKPFKYKSKETKIEEMRLEPDTLTNDEADAYAQCLCVVQQREATYVHSLSKKGVMLFNE